MKLESIQLVGVLLTSCSSGKQQSRRYRVPSHLSQLQTSVEAEKTTCERLLGRTHDTSKARCQYGIQVQQRQASSEARSERLRGHKRCSNTRWTFRYCICAIMVTYCRLPSRFVVGQFSQSIRSRQPYSRKSIIHP